MARAHGIRSLPLLLGLWAAAASAVTIIETSVTHDAGRYTVRFDVLIDAGIERVRPLVADYDRLTRLSPIVVESRVLATRADGGQRIQVTLNGCVLIFCQTIKKVQEVRTAIDGAVTARTDPGESDFTFAEERWRVLPQAQRTHIHYEAEFVPGFFVPPLIGPWIVKSKIRTELETTAARLELLAAEERAPADAPVKENTP